MAKKPTNLFSNLKTTAEEKLLCDTIKRFQRRVFWHNIQMNCQNISEDIKFKMYSEPTNLKKAAIVNSHNVTSIFLARQIQLSTQKLWHAHILHTKMLDSKTSFCDSTIEIFCLKF